ncbi:OmpA family protein [Algoriphagus namhaensis]
MFKSPFFIFLFFLVATRALAQSSCESHPLFSALPEHAVTSCEEREFDVLETRYVGEDGSWAPIKKSGYFLKTWYNFTGDWEKRPSNALIFENYKQAVLSKSGKVVYESSGTIVLQVSSAGEKWWIEVISDQSGAYQLTCVREASMNQYIVLSADDIAREIKSSGKATFYGVYFDNDKSEVKPESSETLSEIAKYLQTYPEVLMYVVGHTDSTGSLSHNQELSQRRAESVVAYLVDNHQIEAGRLKAHGVASLSPVSTNDSEEGRAKNRRVELVLR